MKKLQNATPKYLAIVMLLVGFIAFTSAAASNHFSLPADIASVEIEAADIDLDGDDNFNVLILHYSFSALYNNSINAVSVAPISSLPPGGFHSKNSTGKSICVSYKKLKLYC